MPSIIRLLSDATINQIAAGEVIESPSSVVKELVENSLDAGALKIVVEILGGGLQMIRISDDGCGMEREDALLCLKRHATSKIFDAKDLFSLKTMGFRGEALASVASISQMTITTSKEEIGTKVEVLEGDVLHVDPCPRNRGTTIEVRRLFFNVPARMKFQKSASGCAAEISKVLTQLSLGYPHVAFELYHHEKKVFSFPAKNSATLQEGMQLRIAEALGDSFLTLSVYVDEQEGPFSIKGFIGTPENTRHNKTGGYLFINQRAVSSYSVSFAIRDAYGTRIASDRHPVFVLYFDMPHHLVDVNVHPQKKEVRLSQESWIKQVIQKALTRSLDGNHVMPLIVPENLFTDFPSEEIDFSLPKKTCCEPRAYYSIEVKEPSEKSAAPLTSSQSVEESIHPIGLWQNYLVLDAEYFSQNLPLMKIQQEGLCLVDLNRAKARVIFERLANAAKDPFHKQLLMFPISFEFPSYEINMILEHAEVISAFGFTFSQAGPKALMIEAIPSYVDEADIKKMFHELAFGCINLDNEEIEGLDIKNMRQLAGIASRFVKIPKGGYQMSEAISLLQGLMKTSSPAFCPQGEKTVAYLSKQHVKKIFSAADG
jgi:DNA mismatch repair protein MutL